MADGEIYTSKPIEASSEQEAAIKLKDNFESFEGIPCEIISVTQISQLHLYCNKNKQYDKRRINTGYPDRNERVV